MNIRIANPKDAEQIATVHTVSWQSTYRGILLDEYLDGWILSERVVLWQKRFEKIDPKQHVLVAEDSNSIVGFACAYGEKDPQWGTMLDNLHVLPALKRKGIGTILIAHIAAWSLNHFPENGMFLGAVENNILACGFYEHLGGVINGKMNWTAPEDTVVKELRYSWTNNALLKLVAKNHSSAFR
jgi:GNAT superfamily N-acetyltransferase